MEMDGAGLASGGSCGGFFSLSESDTATPPVPPGLRGEGDARREDGQSRGAKEHP
jgi:hypothetical protein